MEVVSYVCMCASCQSEIALCAVKRRQIINNENCAGFRSTKKIAIFHITLNDGVVASTPKTVPKYRRLNAVVYQISWKYTQRFYIHKCAPRTTSNDIMCVCICRCTYVCCAMCIRRRHQFPFQPTDGLRVECTQRSLLTICIIYL